VPVGEGVSVGAGAIVGDAVGGGDDSGVGVGAPSVGRWVGIGVPTGPGVCEARNATGLGTAVAWRGGTDFRSSPRSRGAKAPNTINSTRPLPISATVTAAMSVIKIVRRLPRVSRTSSVGVTHCS
jgi:hypothetical protein